MTLLHYEGFEAYENNSDFNVVKTEIVDTYYTNGIFGDTYGRRSSRGIRLDDNTDVFSFELNESNVPDEVVVGFALYQYDGGDLAYVSGYPLLELRDFNGGSIHLRVYPDVSRNFKVYRSTTYLGTTSGKTLSVQTYHYLEVKVKIHGTLGTVEIWLDGTKIMDLDNLDTLEGSNAYVRYYKIRTLHSGRSTFFDDFYLLDTGGAAPCNDRLGDVRVDVLRPEGVGTHGDFTPSAGDNYENADEVYPDDDTTYNDGSNVADQDSYAMEDPEALGATIFGVKSQVTCKKTDAGARGYKILSRFGGSDYLSNEIFPATTFETQAKIYELNPDDSEAFEEADVNGMETAVEITT